MHNICQKRTMERFKTDVDCFVCALYLSMGGSNQRGIDVDVSMILKGWNGSGVTHSCFGGGVTSGGCWVHLRPAAAGPSRTSETEFTKTCEAERRKSIRPPGDRGPTRIGQNNGNGDPGYLPLGGPGHPLPDPDQRPSSARHAGGLQTGP